MSHRAAVWKNILLGDEYKITCLRNHYYNCVKKYPRLCPEKIKKIIKRDIPRTYSNSSFYKQRHNRNNIETLLCQFAVIHPADNYLQGFNYIMATLYYVYYNHDPEHAMADTWWSFCKILACIRPCLPDDSINNFKSYTNIWTKYFKKHLQKNDITLYHIIMPYADSIFQNLQIKWLMIWFCQNFSLEDIVTIWDALITCEPTERAKLKGIISANILIQSSTKILDMYTSSPTEVAYKLINFKAVDPGVIIKNSRDAMLTIKLPYT